MSGFVMFDPCKKEKKNLRLTYEPIKYDGNFLMHGHFINDQQTHTAGWPNPAVLSL